MKIIWSQSVPRVNLWFFDNVPSRGRRLSKEGAVQPRRDQFFFFAQLFSHFRPFFSLDSCPRQSLCDEKFAWLPFFRFAVRIFFALESFGILAKNALCEQRGGKKRLKRGERGTKRSKKLRCDVSAFRNRNHEIGMFSFVN